MSSSSARRSSMYEHSVMSWPGKMFVTGGMMICISSDFGDGGSKPSMNGESSDAHPTSANNRIGFLISISLVRQALVRSAAALVAGIANAHRVRAALIGRSHRARLRTEVRRRIAERAAERGLHVPGAVTEARAEL